MRFVTVTVSGSFDQFVEKMGNNVDLTPTQGENQEGEFDVMGWIVDDSSDETISMGVKRVLQSVRNTQPKGEITRLIVASEPTLA